MVGGEVMVMKNGWVVVEDKGGMKGGRELRWGGLLPQRGGCCFSKLRVPR
jgi:hypothetical protein